MLQMKEHDFIKLTTYIQSHYGINLTKKKTLIEGRLNICLAEKGLSSFEEYLELIFADQSGNEMTQLLNKLTTNHTFFMRESSHFALLRDQILPEMVGKSKERDLRIWSAGCSTGEEPYTLAMIIADFLGAESKQWDARVLATDISARALEQAENAIYKADQLADMPAVWKAKYFEKAGNETYRVSDKISKNVIFRAFNLMDKQFPFKRKFQVIFCRNVMIYFDRPTKIELVKKFYEAMEPGGYLLIGHSESIGRDETDFKYIMPAVYRKE